MSHDVPQGCCHTAVHRLHRTAPPRTPHPTAKAAVRLAKSCHVTQPLAVVQYLAEWPDIGVDEWDGRREGSGGDKRASRLKHTIHLSDLKGRKG